MPSFQFFGTWDDSWTILQAILEQGDFEVTPDIRFEAPEPLKANHIDEKLKSMCQERGGVYIWSKQYTVHPPHLVRIEEGKYAGRYFVDMSKGGPGVNLHLPVCYTTDGLIRLSSGSLWLQSRTLNTEKNVWEPPSTSLKAGYRKLINLIKRHLTVWQSDSKVWIGEFAKQLLESGIARITV